MTFMQGHMSLLSGSSQEHGTLAHDTFLSVLRTGPASEVARSSAWAGGVDDREQSLQLDT